MRNGFRRTRFADGLSQERQPMHPAPSLQRVVFLDRDGVINRDSPDYIKRLEEFEFLPGSLEALRRLTERRFRLHRGHQPIRPPARGFITREALDAIHHRLCAAVAEAGGRILDIFVCPHLPADGCACRKPGPACCTRPGAETRDRLCVSRHDGGDSVTDIECARNAGVRRRPSWFRTGNGEQAARELSAPGACPGLHRARTSTGRPTGSSQTGSSAPASRKAPLSASRTCLTDRGACRAVRIRCRGRGHGEFDELDAFLLEELFFRLGADAADVARLGRPVVDLQRFLGEVAADVVEVLLDEFGDRPG
ncbi:MAG: hypothetical protein MZV70_49575 [Desulfobacterales bacterium]|nr:hypothetical protein [Desulfobacterales bacterium]